MKWYRKPAALLFVMLLLSSLVMTATGLALKHTVARSNKEISDTIAIAVPFLLLRGDVALNEEVPDVVPEIPDTEAISTKPMEIEPTENLPKEEKSFDFAPVEESYFDTTLFIGDSRTVGLALYGRLGKADYFADVGMSLFNLFDKKISDKGFSSQDLKTLLHSKQYKTIYLMLGINEVGYPVESIQKRLESVLNEIKTLQPDALIVLEANLVVTKAKEAKNPQISTERIRTLNEKMKSYADNKRIFYLDVNPYFVDEGGYLRSEVTSDGTHPYATEYKNWANWLKEHGIQETKK